MTQIGASNILYGRYNKEHFRTQEKEYQAWRMRMQKTHDYLGLTPYYETEIWRNRETGQEEEY